MSGTDLRTAADPGLRSRTHINLQLQLHQSVSSACTQEEHVPLIYLLEESDPLFYPLPPPVLFPGRMRQETEMKRADVSSVLSRMKSNARLHCAWQGHRSLAGSMNARRGMGGPSSDGAVDQRCHLRAYVAKLSSLHTNSNTHKHQQHIVWPVLVCSLRRCAKQGSSARSRVENWVTFLLGFT